MSNSKLLSIITINYNNLEGLNRTINSVINQSFRDFEYIVIDGGSTDGSKELIEKFANSFSFWISESDKGIYDAMNKGIKVVKGQWTLFLNSGDYFPNKNTLELIFKNKNLDKYDILYGGVIKVADNKLNEVEPSELCSIFYKMPFCHQSSIVKTTLLKVNHFDTRYKIASDYDFFCRAYKNNKKFKRIDINLSVFVEGGISSVHKDLMYNEFSEISTKYFNKLLRLKLYVCYRMHVAKRKIITPIFPSLKW